MATHAPAPYHRSMRLVLVALLVSVSFACTRRPSAELDHPERSVDASAGASTSATAKPTPTGPRWVDITVESEFGCAVERSGAVYCWGRDAAAQMDLRALPDGPARATNVFGTPPSGPISAVEGIHDAKAIASVSGLTCAIVGGGRIRCWGAFAWGSPHVFEIPELSDAVALELGASESCATLASGELWCWSSEGHGVPRLRMARASAVAVSDTIACGLGEQGEIACWGPGVRDWYRYDVQFNQGQGGSPFRVEGQAEREYPDRFEVGRFRGAVDIVMSEWNKLCVLQADAKVLCSHRDLFAVLRGEELGLREVAGLDDVAELHATRTHACARTRADQVQCWGRNVYGQLGDGSSISRERAAAVVGLREVVDLDVSEDFSCALTRAGEIRCWGFDRGEALSREPIHAHTVVGLDARSLVAGGNTTCATDAEQRLRCWGAESIEALGITAAAEPAIVDLGGPAQPLKTMSSNWDTCLLFEAGELRCGSWIYGGGARQLSTATRMTGVEALAGGQPPICAILSSGAKPELACGQAIAQLEPEPRIKRPSALASGSMRACVVHDGGKVSCFAEFYYWGDGPRPPRDLVTIPGIHDAVVLSNAMYQDCALGRDGRVRCWVGRSESVWSEDGRTATAVHYRAGQVEDLGLVDIVGLVAGSQHHCALSKAGAVRCWDDNPYHESRQWLATPALPDDIVELAAGAEHTCARSRAGAVTCWGEDTFGQLGRVPSRVYLEPTIMPVD
jgi:alpha-tubulin suppressor-like RCC1 family protein